MIVCASRVLVGHRRGSPCLREPEILLLGRLLLLLLDFCGDTEGQVRGVWQSHCLMAAHHVLLVTMSLSRGGDDHLTLKE